MKIQFAPEASKDLDDAVAWYNAEKEDLGYRFAHVVDETILRAARYPYFNTEVDPGVHRALVKRFPYAVFYSVTDDVLMVYAVGHMHRMPFFWGSRIG